MFNLEYMERRNTVNTEWRLFAEEAISCARKAGATYADVRIFPVWRSEGIGTENGNVASYSESTTSGFGVRVIVDGAWGFYSTDDLKRERITEIVNLAVLNAKANAHTRKTPVELLPLREDEVGKEYVWHSPFETDPFTIPADEKIKLLLAADKAMREAGERIFLRQGHIISEQFRKILLTWPDNVFADQTFTRVNASVIAMAQRDQSDPDKQACSYPSHHGGVLQRGWEAVLEFDLVNNARRIAAQADEFLFAPECPTGARDVILMPEQNNLHATHEMGHGYEGDRVDEKEHTLAGGSFLTPLLPRIGEYRYGSPAVTLVADSITPGGVGTFACDDEGVPAKRIALVENGIWKGLLVSRESAGSLNRRMGRNYFTEASGAMRASSYGHLPLIRMNNISLLPGEMSYEEMLDRVPIGTIRFGNNKSWSMSDDRGNFYFGSEVGWEKARKNGSATWRPVRNPVYHGDSLKFFLQCEAVADAKSAVLLGVANCGKGYPCQTMATGHRTPPTWFRGVKVDSARNKEVGHE